MTPLASSLIECSAVEQVDELTRNLGWSTEYRQLKPGCFNSSWRILEGDSWFLMEERSSRSVEIQAPAPDGMYVLALADGDPGVVNGQAMTTDHLTVQGPDSDFRVTLAAGVKIPQIGIPANQFEETVRAVAPGLSVPRSQTFTTAIRPGQASHIRRAIRALLYTPSLQENTREVAVSNILVDCIVALAEHHDQQAPKILHRANAWKAMNKAQEYIEENLDRKICITALCRHAGTSLSTLERTFCREMGVTPQAYLKARRLNVVRRRLLEVDREQDSNITMIALGCGITHMGRFAGEYRSYFGEYPSQTLNR